MKKEQAPEGQCDARCVTMVDQIYLLQGRDNNMEVAEGSDQLKGRPRCLSNPQRVKDEILRVIFMVC